ncbi:MAG: hypothetical protein ACOY3P_20790 [Planctomycetota bacterium]
MNFFHWIRDGVRQAVLLGVNDAVGDLGSPADDDAMSRRLLELIRTPQPALTADTGVDSGRRRKLGRGLEQIQSTAKAG